MRRPWRIKRAASWEKIRWNGDDGGTSYLNDLVYSVLDVAGECCRDGVRDGDVEGFGCILANVERNIGIELAYLDGIVLIYAGVLDL